MGCAGVLGVPGGGTRQSKCILTSGVWVAGKWGGGVLELCVVRGWGDVCVCVGGGGG